MDSAVVFTSLLPIIVIALVVAFIVVVFWRRRGP